MNKSKVRIKRLVITGEIFRFLLNIHGPAKRALIFRDVSCGSDTVVDKVVLIAV